MSLADALRGINAEAVTPMATKVSGKITPAKKITAAAARTSLPLRGTAKKNHPDFVQKTVYVRRDTVQRAWRRFEDQGGKELSELVQRLLEEYLEV